MACKIIWLGHPCFICLNGTNTVHVTLFPFFRVDSVCGHHFLYAAAFFVHSTQLNSHRNECVPIVSRLFNQYTTKYDMHTYLNDFYNSHVRRGVFRLTSRGRRLKFFLRFLNVQVKFLVIFKSGESLIFVFFFLSYAGFTKNRLLCSFFLTSVCVLKVTLVFYLIFH
jgi:hypothetical protein